MRQPIEMNNTESLEKVNTNISLLESDESENLYVSDKTEYDENLEINKEGLVTFSDSSSLRAKNWSFEKKITYTITYSFVTFAAQFNSTTTASTYFFEEMKHSYNAEREVSVLTISLYIFGIAFGPMIFAPLSEVYSRKIAVLIPFFISSLFTFVTSISYNIPSIMITRFLGGFFAGAPIVSAGGVLADLWDPSFRGVAFALYACFVANGASFGPIISSLLTHSNPSEQSWRIALWFCGLCQLILFLCMYIFTEETFEPKVLQNIIKKEKIKSKNWFLHTTADSFHLDWKQMISLHVIRPFVMLTIPIIFTMALFASYVYGLFYLMITNISTSFELTRGWEGTKSELPNASLFLGVLFGCFENILWALKYSKLVQNNEGKAIPEQRFPIMMILGWMMPAGIFIFGWTSKSNIHWTIPCVGIMMIGAGFITIFQGCINYLVDLYPRYAASAIAANTFLRSVFAAVFPLFAKQLFVNLGVSWGSSLIGFIALGMIPIPFVLYLYAERIRNNNDDRLQN